MRARLVPARSWSGPGPAWPVPGSEELVVGVDPVRLADLVLLVGLVHRDAPARLVGLLLRALGLQPGCLGTRLRGAGLLLRASDLVGAARGLLPQLGGVGA